MNRNTREEIALYDKKEKELIQVNTQLTKMRQNQRGLQKSTKSVTVGMGGFVARMAGAYLGLTALIARSVVGLWNINQSPVLQKINLPEAQGKISSANQFLEAIGSGTGPIIAGFLLITYGQNFQLTILITMILGTIGGLLWLLATIWINKDVNRVSTILTQREKELTNKIDSEKENSE